MDPQVRKRLTTQVKWYKWLSTNGAGENTFDAPVIVLGYVVLDPGITVDREGLKKVVKSKVILDETLADISTKDQLEVSYIGRCPILRVQPLTGLHTNIGSWEVLV